MAERSAEEILTTFMEEVRLTETASSPVERLKHFRLAEADYQLILADADGCYESAEVKRASRAMEHLQSLLEGDEGAT